MEALAAEADIAEILVLRRASPKKQYFGRKKEGKFFLGSDACFSTSAPASHIQAAIAVIGSNRLNHES